MSDYTIAVGWSEKDALADSDANKVISGADFNTEFSTVRTAINSKADLNGDAGESFSCTTASTGTNTTQTATTAFVTTAVAALDAATINALVYPIGSIYTTVSATAPATLLGMGTWAAFGAGRVPVGIDASDTDFDTVEETGGTKTHTLTIDEIPAHTHSKPYEPGATAAFVAPYHDSYFSTGTNVTGSTGGGTAHNNVQPYITVYMWKRTA